jgi:hypothetical protein
MVRERADESWYDGLTVPRISDLRTVRVRKPFRRVNGGHLRRESGTYRVDLTEDESSDDQRLERKGQIRRLSRREGNTDLRKHTQRPSLTQHHREGLRSIERPRLDVPIPKRVERTEQSSLSRVDVRLKRVFQPEKWSAANSLRSWTLQLAMQI